MKTEDARMLHERGFIKCGPHSWNKDIPTGRLVIKYLMRYEEWRTYRKDLNGNTISSHCGNSIRDALRWAEQVEEAVSHEGD